MKGLPLDSFFASSADGADVIAATLSGSAAKISDVFLGYSNGLHETTWESLSDATFIGKMKDQHMGTYRYPGGTLSNIGGRVFGEDKRLVASSTTRWGISRNWFVELGLNRYWSSTC